jgi:response regulator NasT
VNSKSKILLVDDDRLVLSTISRSLERLGYEVIGASTAEQTLRMCEEQSPDLVILDIRMPGMSGIDAAARIRQIDDIPVIFLSGFSDREIVSQAVQQGGLAYLVKPLHEQQLGPAVEAALARAGDLRALRESEKGLNQALSGARAISIATGLLMERANLTSDAAYEHLRQYARARQTKLSDLAQEAVRSADTLAALSQAASAKKTPNQ